MAKTFTKAAYATHVAAIVREATFESAFLAQGMWNPLFCGDDATEDAHKFSEKIQRLLDNIQTHAANLASADED